MGFHKDPEDVVDVAEIPHGLVVMTNGLVANGLALPGLDANLSWLNQFLSTLGGLVEANTQAMGALAMDVSLTLAMGAQVMDASPTLVMGAQAMDANLRLGLFHPSVAPLLVIGGLLEANTQTMGAQAMDANLTFGKLYLGDV